MCDLVDFFLDPEVFRRDTSIKRSEAMKKTSDWLTFMFVEPDVGGPEKWSDTLDCMVSGSTVGRISRPEALDVLNKWRELALTLTSLTFLEQLVYFTQRFQPRLLRFFTSCASETYPQRIADLRKLCAVKWTPLIPHTPAIVPTFPVVLLGALRVLEGKPALAPENCTEPYVHEARYWIQLMLRIATPSMTLAQCCQFLDLLPRTVYGGGLVSFNMDMQKVVRIFIALAAAQCEDGWDWTKILAELSNFIRAGRIGYQVVDNIIIQGEAEHEAFVDIPRSRDRIRLIASEARVTYFAEAHTYACGDLRDIALKRAPIISFWPVEYDRARVADEVAQLLLHDDVQALALAVWPRRSGAYLKKDIGDFEVGFQIINYEQHGGRRVWQMYLTHLCPTPGKRIPKPLLQVLRTLLTD